MQDIYIYIYMDTRWLSCWSVRLPCGRSRVRVPAEVDTKTFADVGNLLTTSVSAGLSNGSGSIHLIHAIQNQEQHNNTPNKNDLHVGTGSRSVPTRYLSLISSRMTYSVICCMSEKKVSSSSYKLNITPL